MTMKNITDKLNELSVGYKIGDLQNIRRELGNIKNRLKPTIFGKGVRSNYAFHLGGREELQFNIGHEDVNKFRYGVAFSLETSQFFFDVEPLKEKIKRYNKYFEENPIKFDSYSAYTEKNKIPWPKHPLKVILEEEYTNHKNSTFFFIGKFFDKNIGDITTEDCHTMLETFDELLDLYRYVESNNSDNK